MAVWKPKDTLDAIGGSAGAGKKRSVRVAEAIRNELATLLISKVSDPRLQDVAISRVEVTPDLSLARIFYTSYLREHSPEDAAAGFRRAAGFLRSHIAKTLNLRFTPVLEFRYDEIQDKVAELEEIFQEIADERKTGGEDTGTGNS